MTDRPSWREIEGRAIAAYLGLALGDALGATVEFMTPREIRCQYGVHDRIRGGGWLKLKSGQVTDDTGMALALGSAILEQGAIEAAAVARAFDAWMRTKPVDIGNIVRRGIVRYRTSGETAAAPSEQDAGNGACMRCLPVALATLGASPEAVRRDSRAQAHVTHNNALSDAACEGVINLVQRSILGASLRELLRGCVQPLVAAHPGFAFRVKRIENPSGYIVETLRAVLQALFHTDSFEACLIDVVNRGGDADTTGAIAGMIAGALYGPAGLPPAWLRALDPGPREACVRQARALWRVAPLARGETPGVAAPGGATKGLPALARAMA